MKKRFIQLAAYLLPALLPLMFVSCHSDAYYKERAVNKAREFLLDDTKNLSQMQREYIKFNKPILLHRNILGSPSDPGSYYINSEIFQICITWTVPGEEDVYMVFGSGNYRMKNWEPIRVIRKKFNEVDSARISAFRNAMLYVMNNMLYLSLEDRNRIRFEVPEVASTNFVLDIEQLVKKTDSQGQPLPEKMITMARNNLKKKQQVSIVFKTEQPGKLVVVAGLSGAELAGWAPVAGMVITADNLSKHTVKETEK